MIKKWLGNMLPKKRDKKIPYQCHPFSASIDSHAAEQVLQRLHHAGFEAYLVGGAVRDLLLGIEPKDFDVATNATPQQVCQIFRRSRIIGRRFPIVHVMIGPETIEVSTFRSGGKVHQNEHGRIMRDNHYGTIDQDAMRRDFTCNALYYDRQHQHIIDYHNGVADIAARKIVMIGEPLARYQEDPVRLLRAIRLAGKLGFSIDEASAEPIAQCTALLSKEPVSRLFDELLKILFSGQAQSCLKQLSLLGNDPIHPLLSAMRSAANQPKKHLINRTLAQTDKRLKENKSVSIGFILAAMLWHEVDKRWQAAQQSGQGPAAAMNSAITQLRDDLEHGWGVTHRYAATMREIWSLQSQFFYQSGNRPHRLIAQTRFRAAYDFLLLRAPEDAALAELAKWWTDFQAADAEKRKLMTLPSQHSSAHTQKKKRRRPTKKKIQSTTLPE